MGWLVGTSLYLFGTWLTVVFVGYAATPRQTPAQQIADEGCRIAQLGVEAADMAVLHAKWGLEESPRALIEVSRAHQDRGLELSAQALDMVRRGA